MYRTPHWYAYLRDVGLLWQALGGVLLFWGALPVRRKGNAICPLFWVLGAVGLMLGRKKDLFFLAYGTNVFLIYFLCIAMVYACRRVSLSTAWMIGATGYLAQQICGNLELALRSIPAIGRFFDYSNRIVLLDLLFFIPGYYLIWFFFHSYAIRESDPVPRRIPGNDFQSETADLSSRFGASVMEENNELSPSQKAVFSLMAALFSFGFYSINQYIRGWENLLWGDIMLNSLYSATGGMILLFMQYSMVHRQRVLAEKRIIQTLLYTQANQWQASRERTQVVNEKYHDLKKMVNSFRGEIDGNHLNALCEAIDAYDDHVLTGNQVADVVLTESREICRLNHIQFTCYVNGADFSFLDLMDWYSLLKNALDNAIEAVSALPKGQERFISLLARREGDMAILHMENPCAEVDLEEGLPRTRKNTDYHGFGMKSMERVVEKHSGTMTCQVENHVFYLDIVMFATD